MDHTLSTILAALEQIDRSLSAAEEQESGINAVLEARTLALGCIARLDAYLADPEHKRINCGSVDNALGYIFDSFELPHQYRSHARSQVINIIESYL